MPEKKESKYSYDANGNLLCINTGNKAGDKLLATNNRTMLWDEENRLLALSDNGFVSNYWYDAAGERTVKMSGDGEGVNINGVVSAGRTGTTNFTAYINPYLVVRNGGEYTKHIYMGSQRITSKVSNSGIFTDTLPTNKKKALGKDFTAKFCAQTSKIKECFDTLGVSYKGVQQNEGLVSGNPVTTASSYFYHSDHLGSSSLITDATGSLVQHVEYVPFGETFLEERKGNWNTPYLFNGKERDEETGLYYYHARYYDPRTSVWLSKDNFAEVYPNISAYVFCANNPLKYTDLTGNTIDTKKEGNANATVADLNRIYKDKYGFDNAFEVKKVTKTKTTTTGMFWRKETKKETITRYQIVGNKNFDWKKDDYTKAMKSLMDDKRNVELIFMKNHFTYQKNSLDRATTFSDFIKEAGGGWVINPSQILISGELPHYKQGEKNPNKHYLGGIILHELLYHISPLGDFQEKHPEKMRNHYNLWNGGKTSKGHGSGNYNW